MGAGESAPRITACIAPKFKGDLTKAIGTLRLMLEGQQTSIAVIDDYFLPSREDLQHVAGHRVVGLDATLVGKRELGELVDLHLARLRAGHFGLADEVNRE